MMIAERVRAYLDYLDPGNRRYLEALRREAEEGEVPVIRRDSERFLRSLLAGLRPERVLELGTAVGYSALVMAEELPPSAHITTVENYAPRIARAKENIGRYGAGRISLIEGDAYELLKEQPDEAYDFVFLDAAKGQYLKWLPELLRVLSPGGDPALGQCAAGGATLPSPALRSTGGTEPYTAGCVPIWRRSLPVKGSELRYCRSATAWHSV